MKLLGFKHKTFLKPYHNLRGSTFTRPVDFGYGWSDKKLQVIDALVKEMILKERIAIVKFAPYSWKDLPVRICAMIPQDEIVGDESIR